MAGGDVAGHRPHRPTTRAIDAVTALFNALGSAWIFALMCLICADVFGRWALSSPIPGVTEGVEISIVGIVFLQLAHAIRSGRITRAETLLAAIRRRRPAVAVALDAVANLAGAALLAIIVTGVWPRMVEDFVGGYYVGTAGLFTFPAWPVKAVIVLGGSLAAIQFLLCAVAALSPGGSSAGTRPADG